MKKAMKKTNRAKKYREMIADAAVEGVCEAIKGLAKRAWAIIVAIMFVLCPNPSVLDTHEADMDANDRVCACACCANDDGNESENGIDAVIKTLRQKLDEKSYDIVVETMLGIE